ncbi:6-phosphogluconate dehydrogenase (decarboxylating) [Beijerinckiaceae bacterium]|nr:6-phosphogluconate dehydrogenase (decarboxylating) [Beijerinckiaceae bacterium]
MQLGIIGLGRMGANMALRLMKAGHECVVYDTHSEPVHELVKNGATGSRDLAAFVKALSKPRAVWLMVPAAAVDPILGSLTPLLEPGDVVIDGGNSYYHDDIRRAARLKEMGLHYVDVGVSGGVWGLERGYCQMIGGETEIVAHLDPIFRALAPGVAAAPRTPGTTGEPNQAESGYLHCGPNGGGHFVKMVHNGIEYGIMAAYSEGLNILKNADVGRASHAVDAETTPLRHPEFYQFDFNIAEIAEVWRRSSVIGSWLLDLTAAALRKNPALTSFEGHVSDSGEGRWTLQAAIDEGVPAPVISAALYARFESRGLAEYADKLLSAMRFEFGGHIERSGK